MKREKNKKYEKRKNKKRKLTKKERQREKNKRQNEKNMHELRADSEKIDSEMERKTETDIDKFVNQLNQLLTNEQTYRLINDSLLAIQT